MLQTLYHVYSLFTITYKHSLTDSYTWLNEQLANPTITYSKVIKDYTQQLMHTNNIALSLKH